MVSASRLLALAGLVWAGTTVLVASGGQLPARIGLSSSLEIPPPSTLASNPDYVGSESCSTCHEDQYEQWASSLHIHMTKPIAEATVIGDFSEGTRFSAHGRSYELGRKDGQPFVRVTAGDRPAETFPVDYTLGFKRFQGYLSTLPDGRMYVLPAFWHVETGRWIDWKEITPIPDGAHGLRQIWNANCFNCHATNLAQGFDVASKVYETTWTEMGIGCEACHGPGKSHVSIMEAWKRDPTQKPPFDNKIFSPATSPSRQVFDTCAYCHGNKQNYFVGFRAGDRYEDYALPFLISGPIPENDHQGEFWPDGRPNRFNRPQALMQSGCFKAGAVTCTNCHVAHGSENPFSLKLNVEQGRTGDLLCTQCHEPAREAGDRAPSIRSRMPGTPDANTPWRDEDIEAHTFHAAGSEGSRCINCHMSDVNWRILIRRRDHSFQPPVPEVTAAYGVPNACTTCHDDRSPEWAAGQMQQFWGDAARRRAAVDVADTMYKAGSGDSSIVPSLMRLAIDRTQGAIVRASAIDYIGQFVAGSAGDLSLQSQTSFASASAGPSGAEPRPHLAVTPELVNVAIGAASDPEPVVRAMAVKTLGTLGRQDTITAAVLARLVDSSRIVRMQAADSLLALGIAQLPGRAGEALTRAQDEFVLGMSMFPDTPSNHVELGWMQAERGRTAEAIEALDTAISLDPKLARPWVLKGVIAAREDRFADAAELWKKAKAIEPGYPNIDKLLAEAEARKK